MKSRYVALALAATVGLGSATAFASERGSEHQQFPQQLHADWRQPAQEHGYRLENHARRDRAAFGYGRAVYAHPNYYGQPYYYPQSREPSGYYDQGDAMGAAVLGAVVGGLLGQLAAGH